jgi:hypothetical protein
MLRKDFQAILSRAPVLLDGATGTYLQSHGMPKGVCPERWALEHRDILFEMHRSYYLAGTDIAVTCTFGANAPKFSHFGMDEDQVGIINRELARIAVEARNSVLSSIAPERPAPLVSGDIGPTGRFLVPAGDLEMAELVLLYRSQVRGLLDGGVDLFSIETMMDLGQTRAALRAIRMECDLPVIATLTFDASGKNAFGQRPAGVCGFAGGRRSRCHRRKLFNRARRYGAGADRLAGQPLFRSSANPMPVCPGSKRGRPSLIWIRTALPGICFPLFNPDCAVWPVVAAEQRPRISLPCPGRYAL